MFKNVTLGQFFPGNSVIHRLLLGLLLGEIKDHQLLGALLTATETFQRWPLCPC